MSYLSEQMDIRFIKAFIELYKDMSEYQESVAALCILMSIKPLGVALFLSLPSSFKFLPSLPSLSPFSFAVNCIRLFPLFL